MLWWVYYVCINEQLLYLSDKCGGQEDVSADSNRSQLLEIFKQDDGQL